MGGRICLPIAQASPVTRRICTVVESEMLWRRPRPSSVTRWLLLDSMPSLLNYQLSGSTSSFLDVHFLSPSSSPASPSEAYRQWGGETACTVGTVRCYLSSGK